MRLQELSPSPERLNPSVFRVHDMLLIIHIPKTAGTSLRVSLQKEYGPLRMALDYWDQSEVTSSIVHRYLYQDDAPLGTKELVKDLRAAGCRAIMGHYPFSKYGEFFLPNETIAFVRQPLVRSCSEYLHKRRHGKFAGTFSEFIVDPVNQNIQTRLLEGCRRESFIGITERYIDSLEILNKRFDLQIKARKENRARRGGGKRFAKSLDQATVDRYCALNQLDINLYRESLNKLEELKLTTFGSKNLV
jgi:hypothetical protein